MLALGEVPVATSNFLDVEGGIFPWAEAALGGAPFTFVTPLSIPYLLDGLVPQLAAAVDGDPATRA